MEIVRNVSLKHSTKQSQYRASRIPRPSQDNWGVGGRGGGEWPQGKASVKRKVKERVRGGNKVTKVDD